MIKVEAIVHEFRLDDVKAALKSLGCDRVVISGVFLNRPHGPKSKYRGIEYTPDLPKIKVETCVSAYRAQEVVDELARVAHSGDDDGMILTYEIADAILVRDRRRLEWSLSD